MSRIAQRFADLKSRREKALVAFVTAGDPLPARTADLVVALAQGGADIVELGIPFSDPLADGPTIQAASQRALDAGMTPPQVLEIVREVRTRSDVPLILMGAWNPILQYGLERFVTDAVAAGVDYPGVGPEHSYFKEQGRAEYVSITDAEALDAFGWVARTEGIIPALETAHAFAHVKKVAKTMTPDQIVVINLSGRGDKDVDAVARRLEMLSAS